MNDQLTDDQVRAAFVARSGGSPSPDLADRIRAAAAGTKQERPAMRLVGLERLTRTRFLAVAAVLGASVAILAGSFFLGGGSPTPDHHAIAPSSAPATERHVATPSDRPATAAPSIRQATPEPSFAPSVVPGGSFRPGSVATVSSAHPLEMYAPLKTIDGPRLPGVERLAQVAPGTSLYIAAGPALVGGIGSDEVANWYLVKPFDQDAPERSFPLGWVPAYEGGAPTIEVGAARCVIGDPAPTDIVGLTAAGALACFGDRDFEVTGRVVCTTNASRPVVLQHRASGPDWLDDGRFCAFWSREGDPYVEIFEFTAFWLRGFDGTGDLVVTGHLDDPRWRDCIGREGPPFVTDAEAEFECRLGFHAMKVALAAP